LRLYLATIVPSVGTFTRRPAFDRLLDRNEQIAYDRPTDRLVPIPRNITLLQLSIPEVRLDDECWHYSRPTAVAVQRALIFSTLSVLCLRC